MNCVVCNNPLLGTKTKFCSKKCKDRSFYIEHGSYNFQRTRGKRKRLLIIKEKGSKCEICGYKKCFSSLTFHHIDPKSKKFTIDIRNCSNLNFKRVIEESKKCKLLCMNCHIEIHNKNKKKNKPQSPVMGTSGKCNICNKILSGKQIKFCSKKCKMKDYILRGKLNFCVEKRGEKRKLDLIKINGGRCLICGYNKCLHALTFHHLNPKKKKIMLSQRVCGYLGWEKIERESKKCILLCMNCHMEKHHKDTYK